MTTIRRYDTFDNAYNLVIPENKSELTLLLILSVEYQKAIAERRKTYDEMQDLVNKNLELIKATRQKLLNR